MSAVTGWEITTAELIETGERIADIRQSFNIREGLNNTEFKVPDRVVGIPPQKEGPLAGITLDEKTLYTDCLKAVDWDLKTGKHKQKEAAGTGAGRCGQGALALKAGEKGGNKRRLGQTTYSQATPFYSNRTAFGIIADFLTIPVSLYMI